MEVRTVLAGSMAEAMRRVRDTFGDDAVILSTQDTEGGVLVDVGMPQPGDEPAPAMKAARPDDIAGALKRHAASSALASRLLPALEAAKGTGRERLAHALGAMIPMAPLALEGGRTVIVTGPPGAGRTTMVARLAAAASLADVPVAVCSADAKRTGGAAILKDVLRILHAPLIETATPEALADACRVHGGKLILVDTPPLDARDAKAGRSVLRLAAGIDRRSFLLVLPATADLSRLPEPWRPEPIVKDGLLALTQIDQAVQIGPVLSFLAESPTPLALLGTSRSLSAGISAATPQVLASLLLTDDMPAAPLPVGATS